MTAQEFIEMKCPTICSIIRELLERNQEKLDASGYIQFETSIQISPENRRTPIEFYWIDGVQYMQNNGDVFVFVSSEDSKDISSRELSEFAYEDKIEILENLLKLFGI